jgi:glutathione S-transferase
MAPAKLTINSKNYGSWSLRGWLLCKMSGLEFEEEMLSSDDPTIRAELLLLSPSFLVPCLTHEGIKVWDTLAIAEYLNEIMPDAGLLPQTRAARAHCRSICGEMHSGFSNLRSALPMNIKGHFPGFKVWAGAAADIERVIAIWRECLAALKGPFLFGEAPCMADAMYAPVCTRFLTYDVKLDSECAAYCRAIMNLPYMQDWVAAAKAEHEEVMELDVEF